MIDHPLEMTISTMSGPRTRCRFTSLGRNHRRAKEAKAWLSLQDFRHEAGEKFLVSVRFINALGFGSWDEGRIVLDGSESRWGEIALFFWL
jgi:hypothetical protein